MPRKVPVKPREIKPDPIFKSTLVAKLINCCMYSGKKDIARKQVYTAFEIIKSKGHDPMSVFLRALENVKPSMEVRPRRIGGAAYQIPMPVKGRRKESLAIRWLVQFARKRPNSEYHTFAEKLASEILDASMGEGGAFKKKQEVEKIAEANRAFAHFRW